MHPLKRRTFPLTALLFLGAPFSAQGADLSLPFHTWSQLSAIQAPYDPDDPLVKLLTMEEMDVWGRIRKGFAIPDLDHPLVANHTQWYSSRPDYFQRTTTRASRYLFHVLQELEKRGMPTELALLPFIESAFNPQALSSAKAAGMWQFIPSTGRDYNLRQGMFMDERRDVIASTDAALSYLQRLHGMFGDWHLALAAYNWGEGSVQRAIKRANAAGVATDFNGLSRFMPAETRNYVPKLQAVKNIIAIPDQYDIALPAVENQPYFVTVSRKRDMDIKLAAQLAELPIEEFRALNPQFNRPVIPGGPDTQILLPQGNAEKFKTNLAKWGQALSSWTAHKVTGARERIETIAKKFGTTPEIIREVNNIPPKMMLAAGSTILVPKAENAIEKNISADIIDTAKMVVLPETRSVAVKVRRGDTLSSIARRHRVGIAQIKQWNNLRRDIVVIGQTLHLNVPHHAAPKTSRKTAKTAVKRKVRSGTAATKSRTKKKTG